MPAKTTAGDSYEDFATGQVFHHAARAMADDERAAMEAAMEPAMCKRFASDVAVWASQQAAASPRRLGLLGAEPGSPLRVRCAGAPHLRGRQAHPGAEDQRAGSGGEGVAIASGRASCGGVRREGAPVVVEAIAQEPVEGPAAVPPRPPPVVWRFSRTPYRGDSL